MENYKEHMRNMQGIYAGIYREKQGIAINIDEII